MEKENVEKNGWEEWSTTAVFTAIENMYIDEITKKSRIAQIVQKPDGKFLIQWVTRSRFDTSTVR